MDKNTEKLKRSLDRLANRKDYYDLFTEYHVQELEELLALIEKSLSEGDSLMIRPGFLSHFVLVWKE